MPANFSVRTRSTQLFTDVDGDNFADAGDVLRTTLTFHNTGTTAIDVTIEDLLNGSTINPGSIKIGPMAVDDAATISGNTPKTFTFAELLGNDIDPDGSNANLIITGVTNLNHGTVVIDPIAKTVTFTPETGYLGLASFDYTVADPDGLTNVAGFEGRVSVTIDNLVWYVDANYAGANGAPDGSYLRPFTSLTPLNDDGTVGTGRVGTADGISGNQDVDTANDTIFVYDRGNAAYNGGITLEAGQKLFGDAHTFMVNGLSIGVSGNQTTINSHSVNNTNYGVTLSTGNEIQGINLDGDNTGTTNLRDGGGTVGSFTMGTSSITGSGQAVDIDQGGALTVSLTSLSSSSSTAEGVHLAGTAANLLTGTFTANAGTIQTSTGTGFLVGIAGGGTASSGGSIDITYGGDITNAGGSTVEIQDRTGGTVDFNGNLTEGTINAGQTGILIDGSAGIINFDGQTFISAGAGTGNGVTLTNNSGTINFNATGTGLDITTTSGGGLTFTGGGTLNITGSANSVVTTTGQVLNLQNGAMGTSGIAFQTLTSGTVASGNAININNLDAAGAGTFSGGTVTIGGTGGAGADGINLTNSNSTFTFASATIDNTLGDGIEINGQAQTQGQVTFTTVNIDGTTGSGVEIVGNGNAVNINGGTIGATNDAASETVLINGGSGNVTINANLTNSTAGVDIVDVSNRTGGTVAFGGTLSSTGGAGGIDLASNGATSTINFTGSQITLTTGGNAAVDITNNSAAINFTGGSLDITTTGGAGFSANATGGSVTVTGNSNTVSTGAGIAVNIQGTDIGAGGVTFNTVGTSGAASGIILANTGSGAFTVVGTTGVNGSGGSILNSTGHGINLTNTGPVSLTGVTITGSQGSGINGTGTTGLSLTNVTSSTNGNAVDEGGVFLINASGNMFVTNSTFNANADDNFAIRNDTGSLNLTVTGSTFSNSYQGAFGDDNLILQANNSANITALITSSTFQNAEGDHFQFATNLGATGSSHVTFTNNTLTNNQSSAVVLGSGVTISPSGSADLRFLATGNTITDTISGFAFNVNAIDTSSLAELDITIQNNTIGASGVAGSGPEQSGAIQGRLTGSGTMDLLIDNNDIFDWGNGSAIDISSAAGATNGSNGIINATVTNNLVTGPQAPGALRALLVGAGASAGTHNNIIRLLLDNNLFDNTYPGALTNDMRFTVFSNAQIQSPGYGGGANDVAAFAAFMVAQNAPGTGTGNAAVGAGTNAFHNTPGGANPTLPSTPTLPPPPMMLAPEPPAPPADDTGTATGTGKDLEDHAGEIPPPVRDGDSGTGNGDTDGEQSGDGGPPVIVDDGVLSQAELDYLVDAAIQRWVAAGASAEQVAAMRAATFSVADMTGVQLGMSDGSNIYIDNDGGRSGWFLDTTPGSDEEYAGTGTRLVATGGAAAQGVDLLTVLMHELGHQAGLGDHYNIAARDDLMYGYAYEGERRLPADGQAAGAVPGSVAHPVFQLGPVVIGTVPGDNAFTVQYDSTVNAQGEDRLVQYFNNDADLSYRDVPAGAITTVSTNSELLAVDSLTIGNRIFIDANLNGAYDAGEGVSGVTLTLYADTNNDGVFSAGDLYIGYNELGGGAGYQPGVDTPAANGTGTALTTTTGADGLYSFSFLAAGDYIVVVDSTNFLSGGPLNGEVVIATATDPDDNVDGDNNGQAFSGFVASRAIRLDLGAEPITDGDADADTNLTLDIGFISINQEPVIGNLNGDDQNFTENGSPLRIDENNDLTIADPDGATDFDGGSLTVTLTGGEAGDTLGFVGASVTLTATPTPGEFNVLVNGTNIGILTSSGTSVTVDFNSNATPARVQELARSFGYLHSGDSPTASTRTFTFTLVDGDGTANGGDDTGVATATIQVVPVNDTPVVAVATSASSTEQVAGTIDAAATITDVELGARNGGSGDYSGSDLTVGRNGGAAPEDLLTFGSSGAFTVNGANLEAPGGLVFATFSGGNGTPLVITFTSTGTPATQALVNAVVQSLQYTYTGDTPPASITLDYAFDDGAPTNAGQGAGGSATGTDSITVNITDTAENVAPVLDLDADDSNSVGTGYAGSFTEGGAAVAISDTDVSITDADAGDDIVSATITITNPEAGDQLTVGSLPATISVDPGSTATNLILTAAPGTSAADFQTAIEAVRFSNSGDNPTDFGTNTSRTINVTVNDGDSDSNVATATITVTGTNDAPVLTVADNTVSGTEDTDLVFNAANGNLISVADPDSNTLTVNLSVTNGRLTLADTSGLSGFTGNGTATVQLIGTAAAINAALDGLVYRGGLNYQGSDTLNINVSDGALSDLDSVAITLADDGFINGDAGNNVLMGTPQRDIFLVQQLGNDSITGLAGNDTFYFGAAFTGLDNVNGGLGADAIILQGDYSAGVTFGNGGVGNIVEVESISLAPGNFLTYGDPGTNFYDYNLTTLDSNVAAGAMLKINGFLLRAGEDLTFDGSAETDGFFTILAGMGVDDLTGGSGNDRFIFGHDGRFGAGDVVDGGAGYDSVYLRGSYSIDFNDVGFAGSLVGIESITLASATDTQFVGGGGASFPYDIIWNDAMLAAGQTITVNGAGLTPTESMWFDGSQETDGKFRLWGGGCHDILWGGAGNDLIYGGAGGDWMIGGDGADIFRYQAVTDSVSGDEDLIDFFEHGVDKIDLSFIDAKTTQAGNQAFTFIGSAAFSGTGAASAGQLRAYLDDPLNNIWFVEGDVDGDGNADIVIQIFVGGGGSLDGVDFTF